MPAPSHRSRRTAGAGRTPRPDGGQGTPLLEVRVDGRREDTSASDVIQREGAGAKLIACRLTERDPRRLIRWLDVDVAPERRNRLLSVLRRRVPRRDLAVSVLGPARLLMRVVEPAPAICLATHRAGGLCVSCPLLSGRPRGQVRAVVPPGPPLGVFLRELRSGDGGRLTIAHLKPFRAGAALTRRQDRALRTAYAMGYFGYPRRGSLADVARALGVGRSATLEVLRRATAKLAAGRYADELRPRGVP